MQFDRRVRGSVPRLSLSKDEISSILSLYHLDGLESYGGVAEGSVHVSCWVRVQGRRYVLRLSPKKRFQDLVYEKDLLGFLSRCGLPVPRVVQNVASGAFTPWEIRGRYVSLFDAIEGRALGVFEVEPEHVRSVGDFLGQLHQVGTRFLGYRRGDRDLQVVGARVDRLKRSLQTYRLPRRAAPDITRLLGELEAQVARKHELPEGVVHGSLTIERARWRQGRLASVVDFERASAGPYVWDLAVAANAWCWEPSASQHGEPAGTFDRARVRALLHGYCAVRPLSNLERDALPAEMRLAALVGCAERMLEYEVLRAPKPTRYVDYRHYRARLAALQDGGAEALLAPPGATA